MKTFARYVFRQAFGAMLLILLSLTGVVWVAVALRQLNVITSEGQDALMFLKMTTLAVPNLMALIAPVALLIAAFHTLNRLNGDSELIVLTAAGAPVWTVARPLVLLGFLLGGALLVANHVVMPWSLRELRDAAMQIRADLIGQVVQPGRFSSPERGLTFHIRERTFEGLLLGMLVHDTREPNQISTYLAERAQIRKDGGNAYLVMQNGHVLRRSGPDVPAEIVQFETYAVDLLRFQPKEVGQELKPRERYLDELLQPVGANSEFARVPGLFQAELHERFANPLYPVAFVMIALAFVGQAKSNRSNSLEPVLIGGASAIGLRLMGFAANNLVAINASFVPLLYAVPLLGVTLSALAIYRNARPRMGRSRWELFRLAVVDRLAQLPRPWARGGSEDRSATAPAGGRTT